MTKSKTFWAVAGLISVCALVFCGYTIYNRLTLHFAKDTLEITAAAANPPKLADAGLPADSGHKQENQAAPKEAPDAAKAADKTAPQPAKGEPQKVKAVKTIFEYKNASAKSVRISGAFTRWKEVRMAKKGGAWKAEVYILPGNYLYHFTVDGKKTPDPGKPKAPSGESVVRVE